MNDRIDMHTPRLPQDRTRELEHDEEMSHWAEEAMTLKEHSGTALRGASAAAHGRAALEAALGGPEAVEGALRGRKTLGRNRPAGRSPKRQTTLPVDLDQCGAKFIGAGGAKDYSELLRVALAEYLERHGASV
ncbi:hypothetical protein SAMN06264364_12940 [Quadrisphaera granulorum]|uniref:Uncharacterized protein n=1 Tax=Quadrisphaera granulorum TaxID=317664 RepID=A0A315ZTM3_9ACTN|nr:hypothetical protein [Quadrisphaera granulorum]PWJ48659.1 hypothetical protein BXY45_12940 [Quadrisphaera granulorum]SZE98381.1 hypothetical protein SAMN06264364_12940 [Quadrisphaera granulorum]